MPTPFRIRTDAVGANVQVDGHDLTGQVRALTVTAAAFDEPTRLTVELTPAAGVIEGEGIVEVVRDATGGDAVRCLDPQTLGAQVNARAGMGTNTAALWLEVVAEALDAQEAA